MGYKLNHKSVIAIIMAMIILLGSFPLGIVNAETGVSISESEYPGFSKLTTSEQTKLKELKLQGNHLKNDFDMYVGIKVLMRYEIVAYQNKGQYLSSYGFGDTNYSRETKREEYRYLGYTLTGGKLTNDKYGNDTGSPVDPDTLPNKKWIYADEELKTWKYGSLEDFNSLFNTPFESTDGTSTGNPNNITPGQVLQKAVGVPFSTSLTPAQIESFKKYAFVNSFVGLATKGSIKLIQNVNGIKFYNTFVLGRLCIQIYTTNPCDLLCRSNLHKSHYHSRYFT